MRIEITTNLSVIRSILAYDDVPKDYYPDVINKVWFILKQDSETAGIIMFEYLNFVLWVPHIFIFKKYRGGNSTKWAEKAVAYMENVLGAKKFLALTPYIAAKKYAEKVGFKLVTVLTKSIQKNGELLDQYVLEK